MRKLVVSMVLGAMVGLAGCSGMSDTQQRTLSGAAIGTIGGYAVGAMTGIVQSWSTGAWLSESRWKVNISRF